MAEFEHTEELVVGFYDRGALQFSDFAWKLASGRQSSVYYNQRKITSFKEGLVVNGREMSVEQQKRVCDLAVIALSGGVDELRRPHQHLYGIPQASTVIGGMVARTRGESYIWERVGTKQHGLSVRFEADFNEGDVVGVIDDVVTDGASKIKSVDNLINARLDTGGVVTMMDREEGGAANLAEAGEQFVPIIGLSSAVNILLEARRIGNQKLDWLDRYHAGLRNDGVATTFCH